MATTRVHRLGTRWQAGQITGVSWAFTGNMVYAFSQMAILICLTRFVSTEVVGYYAFAAACTNPIVAFANLQLRSYQATDARAEYQFTDYLTLRIFMLGFGGIATLVVCTAIRADHLLVSIVLLLLIRKAIDSVSDVIYGRFQQQGRMDGVAKSMIATGIGSLIGLALVVRQTGSLEAGLAVSAAITAAILLGYTIPASIRLDGARQMTAPSRGHTLRRLARATAPLGLATLLLSITESIPTYAVGNMLGPEPLGIFAVFWYITTIGSTAITAIGQTLSRHFGIAQRDGDLAGFRSLLVRICGLSLGLAIVGAAMAAAFGRPILALVYSEAYARQADVLVVLLLAAGLGYAGVILGFGLVAARMEKVQLAAIATTAVVTTTAGWVAIPRFGLMGAAAAIAAGGLAQVVIGGGVLWQHTRTPRPGSGQPAAAVTTTVAATTSHAGRRISPVAIGLSCVAVGAGVGLLSPSLLVMVEQLGRNIPKTNLIPDYVFAMLWAVLLGLSIACFPVPASHRIALAALWLCRMGTSLGFMLIVEAWYPGADAYDYYLWANDHHFEWHGFTLGDGNKTITNLVWFQDQIFPDSFHALKVTWSFIGLVATYLFYRAIALVLRRDDRRLFFLIGAAPSVLYWSSILGKDPVSLLGMGLYAYGVIAWYQKDAARYLGMVAIGIVIVTFIRSWYGPLMVVPLLAFVFGRTARNTTRSWRVRVTTLAVLAAGFAVFWTQSKFTDSFSSTDAFLRTTSSINTSFANGGSATEVAPATSLGSLILHLPAGIVSALFRPLPGELFSPFGLIAGFENLVFLLWIGLLLLTVTRHHLKDPVVIWLLAFTLMWGAQYGLTASSNLGSLVRYRLQVLPMLICLLILLSAPPRFGPSDAGSLVPALRLRLAAWSGRADGTGPLPPVSSRTLKDAS